MVDLVEWTQASPRLQHMQHGGEALVGAPALVAVIHRVGLGGDYSENEEGPVGVAYRKRNPPID